YRDWSSDVCSSDLVPVEKTVIKSADGAVSGIEYGFDLSDAPIPDRKFVADTAGLVEFDDGVRLLFGQQKNIGTGLRSLVAISMTNEAVARFLKTCDTFLPTLRKW